VATHGWLQAEMLKKWIYAYLLFMPALISADRTDSAKSQINSRLFRVSVKSAPVFFDLRETSRRIVELPRGFLLREDISPAFKKFDKNQWTATHVGYIRNLDLESIKPELDWYVFSITGHFCTYDSSKKFFVKNSLKVNRSPLMRPASKDFYGVYLLAKRIQQTTDSKRISARFATDQGRFWISNTNFLWRATLKK
jgi:hypothetical protein